MEKGFDWYVVSAPVDPVALSTAEFNGVLAAWKQKLGARTKKPEAKFNPAEMTVGQLVASLKPTQLWSLLAALSVSLAGAFALGAKLP